MEKIILQTIFSFASCLFFSITFNTPKKELIFCGLTGAIGMFVYSLSANMFNIDIIIATFLGTIFLTATSRFLSHLRQAPSTIYLIPGILPLVPGSYMYKTMYGLLKEDMVYFYSQGVFTVKLAGVIAFGVMIVLALPYSFFNFIKK